MEQFKNILFIDIETVPIVPEYTLLTQGMQAQWDKKSKYLKSDIEENASPAALFGEKAGIFSEFAKVICIGFASFHLQGDNWKFRMKSLINDDEKVLLNDFSTTLARFIARNYDLRFCGHNIKEFDIPFLCRRMVINAMPLPDCMQLSGKKPWEINHLDTLELWRFGDYKHFTSLALLAEVLGIPSPKDDIDGSMVGKVYWGEKDLERIGKYCLRDVLTTAKVFLRLKGITDEFPEPVFVNDNDR
jgi:3'-5' exonuclease